MREAAIGPAPSRIGRMLARLAWWRAVPKGNAVTYLDANMLRDIGLPESEVDVPGVDADLARSRDRGLGMW